MSELHIEFLDRFSVRKEVLLVFAEVVAAVSGLSVLQGGVQSFEGCDDLMRIGNLAVVLGQSPRARGAQNSPDQQDDDDEPERNAGRPTEARRAKRDLVQSLRVGHELSSLRLIRYDWQTGYILTTATDGSLTERSREFNCRSY